MTLFNHFKLLVVSLLLFTYTTLVGAVDGSSFKNPDSQFYPMPFWHINGEMTKEGIVQQMQDAKHKAKFEGVTILPVKQTLPVYLSKDYFEQYQTILDTARDLDMKVILYDDTGFPSGSAGGLMEKNHPDLVRRELIKHEYTFRRNRSWRFPIPQGPLMAAVAWDQESNERINLKKFIKDGELHWPMPRHGDWKILFFTTEIAPFFKDAYLVDYLNPKAVEQFIEYTYEEYAKRFSSYFGDRIDITFFDDVGFLWVEKTWTDRFNEKFHELYGLDPAPFYPALWYDIGEDTQTARVMLFNTRAELLAEGYPKKVHEWSEKHGLKSTGHPPGNYNIQPVDMHGDIFKFYRYTDMPLMDYIISYGRGRDGYKLISSAATLYDRPVVATEIYGAIDEDVFDNDMLYRMMMELFARGVNFVVPHGMWYDPDHVHIPPLVSPFSEKIVDELPSYSDYVARASYMLRGGRSVAEIGLMYPINSLQAEYYFDEPSNKKPGGWAYKEADYLDISHMLSTQLHRDFSFVHPEYLASDTYKLVGSQIKLTNREQHQTYDILIMPGGKTISLTALKKIEAFYDNGGKVIATTLLPTKSAELGQDKAVQAIVQKMFGVDADRKQKLQRNKNGGMARFLAEPTAKRLSKLLNSFDATPDVIVTRPPKLEDKYGIFSYLHKVRGDRHIYFFANSSNEPIETKIQLKGLHNLRVWDPHNGSTDKALEMKHVKVEGETYTQANLKLDKVKSVFWVSE